MKGERKKPTSACTARPSHVAVTFLTACTLRLTKPSSTEANRSSREQAPSAGSFASATSSAEFRRGSGVLPAHRKWLAVSSVGASTMVGSEQVKDLFVWKERCAAHGKAATHFDAELWARFCTRYRETARALMEEIS